jgi:hypothetical protein
MYAIAGEVVKRIFYLFEGSLIARAFCNCQGEINPGLHDLADNRKELDEKCNKRRYGSYRVLTAH